MGAHMARLARDPGLAGRLGKAAHERVAAEFSMETSVAGLCDILREAAERGR
jgi:hypothetical protein